MEDKTMEINSEYYMTWEKYKNENPQVKDEDEENVRELIETQEDMMLAFILFHVM